MLQKLRKMPDFCFLTRSSGGGDFFVCIIRLAELLGFERFSIDAQDHIKLKRENHPGTKWSADTTWMMCSNRYDMHVMLRYGEVTSGHSKMKLDLIVTNNQYFDTGAGVHTHLSSTNQGCALKKRLIPFFNFNNWLNFGAAWNRLNLKQF